MTVTHKQSLSFRIKIEPSDMVALSRAVRAKKLSTILILLVMALASIIAGIQITLFFFPGYDFIAFLVAFDISGALLLVLFFLFRKIMIRRNFDLGDLHTFSEKETTFDSRGIHSCNEYLDSFMDWRAVSDIRRGKAHIFVFLNKIQAYILPFRVLPSDLSPDDVLEKFQSWHSVAKGGA